MANHANPAQAHSSGPVGFELTLLPLQDALDRPKPFRLDRTLRIGANPGNHIVIAGAGVDAFHARFIPGLDAPIFDIGDAHATIDGLVVRGRVGLIPGDTISIGEHKLRVSLHGTAADIPTDDAVASWLLVSQDELASMRLSRDVTIGSSEESDIVLSEPGVAACHAQLVLRDGGAWVRDLSNGATFVDGALVKGAHQLVSGQLLSIADHGFRIDRDGGCEPDPHLGVSTAAAKCPTRSATAEVSSVDALQMDDSIALTAANWDALVWEIDEPVAIPAEEGVLAENVARFGPPSARLDALVPMASRSGPVDQDLLRVSRSLPTPSAMASPVSARRRAGRRRIARSASARWRLPALVFIVSLVAFATAGSPESRDWIAAMLQRQTFASAVDRFAERAQSVRQAAGQFAGRLFANPPAPTPAVHAEPEARTAPVPAQPSNQMFVQATRDILELKGKAERGDDGAKARLAELGDFYSKLASSAFERGDPAIGKRQLAIVELIRSKPEQTAARASDSAGAAPRVEALSRQSKGPTLQPPTAVTERSVGDLVERLLVDANDQTARRDLAHRIGSLNVEVRNLISQHRFGSARALLVQLERDGIPVLSHGNVRPRPQFVDAPSWHALAVASLLVEADTLIQAGQIATLGTDNAISRLEWATHIDPTDPLVEDMRAKTSGILLMQAQHADRQGLTEEADRLDNLAAYVRDGFQS